MSTQHHASAPGVRSATGLDPVALFAFQSSYGSARRMPPEMSLMAAVLEDAVHCIHKNLHAKRGRARHEFIDAWSWIFDGERSWPFAFENVCDTLGLSADAVRRTIGELLMGGNGCAGKQAAA